MQAISLNFALEQTQNTSLRVDIRVIFYINDTLKRFIEVFNASL